MEKSAKRKRFEKVASGRVQKVIDYLELIQNCSNRNNYEYTEEDVDHMFGEMNKALKNAKDSFVKELEKSQKKTFRF